MSLHKEISFETETKGEPDSSPGYAGKLRCSVSPVMTSPPSSTSKTLIPNSKIGNYKTPCATRLLITAGKRRPDTGD